MKPPVVGYATPGKAKARELLQAFCGGAGGQVVDGGVKELQPGAAAFYGVTPATRHLWEQAKREGRDWYYLDNAYFDKWRGVHYRATLNRLQHPGTGRSDGKRFQTLGIRLAPWTEGGEHVCLAPQSDEFMHVCAGYKGRWVDDAFVELPKRTERVLRLLPWDRDKAAWYKRLPPNLVECHALVTYSSASAISAIVAGVPAIATAEDCIARPLTGRGWDDLERLAREGEREPWCGVVADNQWTLDEMRSGLAWRMLQEQREEARAA